MASDYQRPEDLNQEELARFIVELFHRIAVQHTLWFRKAEPQLGFEKALDAMKVAFDKTNKIQMESLGEALGFAVQDGLPEPLLDMPKEKLLSLCADITENWLAPDGVWLQAADHYAKKQIVPGQVNMPHNSQSHEETYAEFLARTGFEDNGEHYQLYMLEAFAADDC